MLLNLLMFPNNRQAMFMIIATSVMHFVVADSAQASKALTAITSSTTDPDHHYSHAAS
jgi:hypothetical protein